MLDIIWTILVIIGIGVLLGIGFRLAPLIIKIAVKYGFRFVVAIVTMLLIARQVSEWGGGLGTFLAVLALIAVYTGLYFVVAALLHKGFDIVEDYFFPGWRARRAKDGKAHVPPSEKNVSAV
jgi:hypothetical protein